MASISGSEPVSVDNLAAALGMSMRGGVAPE